jgi:hypothetical protein
MALLMLYNRQRTQITSNQGGKEIISTTNRKRGDWRVRDRNAASVESSYGPINRIVSVKVTISVNFLNFTQKRSLWEGSWDDRRDAPALDNVELL